MDRNEFITEVSLPSGFMISSRYEVLRYLGSGATGSVFLARDRLLEDTIVAVKVLRMSAAKSHEQIRRFLREVKLMNSVNHPNVVRTFDAGTDRDLIYFTMEYIRGDSLEHYAENHELTFEQIREILLNICTGLEAIHNADIIHRDLKPGNIIIDERFQLKIADFGVARPVSSSLTQTGSILGSFDYMAPEIWEGMKPTPAVDLYSLGVILYELTVGHPPFYSAIPAQIMRMHLHEIPVPPAAIREDVPSWLNTLVMRLLAKTPAERPASARVVRDMVPMFDERSALNDLFDGNLHNPGATSSSNLPALASTKSDDTDVMESILAEMGPAPDSACESIIFRPFPTDTEIRAHEQRVMRIGLARANDPEEAERQRLRRLLMFARVAGLIAVMTVAWIAVTLIRNNDVRLPLRRNTSGRPWEPGMFGGLSLPKWWGNSEPSGSAPPDQGIRQIEQIARSPEVAPPVGQEPPAASGNGAELVVESQIFAVSELINTLRGAPPKSIPREYGDTAAQPAARPSGESALPSAAEVQGLVRFNEATDFIGRYPDLRESSGQVRLYDVQLLQDRGNVLETDAFKERTANRLRVEQALSIIEWRLTVANRGLSNEAALKEVQFDLDRVDSALRAAQAQLSGEKLKYARWNIFRERMAAGDILGVAQLLRHADGVVAEKKNAYDTASGLFNALRNSHDESGSGATNPAVAQAGEELERRGDELHDALWSVLEGGTRRQLAAMVQFAGVVDMLSRQQQDLVARRSLLMRIAAGDERRMTREELSARRDQLDQELSVVGASVSGADVRAARLSEIISVGGLK